MNFRIILLAGILLTTASCRLKPTHEEVLQATPDSVIAGPDLEAWEDSVELAVALARQAEIPHILHADLETEPVASPSGEDAADDPAIWFNQTHPSKSRVLGTDKNAGIYVYDLEGKVLQFCQIGEVNNVDLRDGFRYLSGETVLVACSNRSNNAITVMVIDRETGMLSDSLANIPSGVDEVYGICCYKGEQEHGIHVFVNGKGGRLEQWAISYDHGFRADLLRTVTLNSQPEGMVADDASGWLYVGVENEGIYRMKASPVGDTILHKLPGSDASNPAITYDIEGLSLFTRKGRSFLLASIQGSFSYALFDLSGEGSYLTSFILAEAGVDGVEETDGLDLVTMPLNDTFRQGLLVVQDGFNTDSGIPASQNFKFVSFERLSVLF